MLANQYPIIESAIEVAADRHGLSTASRVYDHFVTIEAMTPGEYAAGGKSIEIRFGIHPSPFGDCLIATTSRGICRFAFTMGDSESAVAELRRAWPNAVIVEGAAATADIANRLPALASGKERLSVVLKGTPFQIKVWEALLRIPFGGLTTYGRLAEEIGSMGASRAVGTAVGQNPIAFLIPCHRVIRKEGKIGEYHYGSTLKTAMIGWERAHTDFDNFLPSESRMSS